MSVPLRKPIVSPSHPVHDAGNRKKTVTQVQTIHEDVVFMPIIGALMGLVCLIGILYLGAYVGLNKEEFRRTELLSQLRTQQDMQANWQQLLAKEAGPSIVEKHAANLNMIPSVPSQTVLLRTNQ